MSYRLLTLISLLLLVFPIPIESAESTLVVGATPWALCYSSAYERVYCADAASDDITVIDAPTASIVLDLPAGDGPGSLYYYPGSDRIYCMSYGSREVAAIDPAVNRIVSSVPARERLAAVCASPKGRRVYQVRQGESKLDVVEASTGRCQLRVGNRWLSLIPHKYCVPDFPRPMERRTMTGRWRS